MMSQHPHRTLWRRDFGVVPAAKRRLARFALQWLGSFPAACVALRGDDTIVSTWRSHSPDEGASPKLSAQGNVEMTGLTHRLNSLSLNTAV